MRNTRDPASTARRAAAEKRASVPETGTAAPCHLFIPLHGEFELDLDRKLINRPAPFHSFSVESK